VSAIITNDKPDPPNSTSTVPIAESNNTICFYIVCEVKWKLNSGCTDHITNNISDFSEYQLLPTPCTAYLVDKTTYISYVGIGTISGTMQVNGQEKTIIFHDVLHLPEIRGHFFSILKIGKKGFVTTFSGSHAMIS